MKEFTSFDDYLDREFEQEACQKEGETCEGRQGFALSSMDQANWALRRIARAQARLQEARQAAEREVERVRAWLEGVEKEVAGERAYFEGLLERYLASCRERDPRVSSLKLPAGRVSFRKQPPEFARDGEKLLAWLKANRPELVKVQESPDWAGLKASAVVAGSSLVDPATGEVVEGVTVVLREPKFVVEVL